jgi:hypothetical protein
MRRAKGVLYRLGGQVLTRGETGQFFQKRQNILTVGGRSNRNYSPFLLSAHPQGASGVLDPRFRNECHRDRAATDLHGQKIRLPTVSVPWAGNQKDAPRQLFDESMRSGLGTLTNIYHALENHIPARNLNRCICFCCDRYNQKQNCPVNQTFDNALLHRRPGLSRFGQIFPSEQFLKRIGVIKNRGHLPRDKERSDEGDRAQHGMPFRHQLRFLELHRAGNLCP